VKLDECASFTGSLFKGGLKMAMQQPELGKKPLPVKMIVLVVAVIILTIFAVQNWAPVPVWPLGNGKPLFLVIAISFILGALIGWLAHSILTGRPRLAPDESVMERNMR
jgi:uncharacterized integral membrane protein